MAIRATKLALNLSSELPQPTAENDVPLAKGEGTCVSQVFFIDGDEDSKWMISVASTRSISCWEITREPLRARYATSWEVEGVLNVIPDTARGTLLVEVKEGHEE